MNRHLSFLATGIGLGLGLTLAVIPFLPETVEAAPPAPKAGQACTVTSDPAAAYLYHGGAAAQVTAAKELGYKFITVTDKGFGNYRVCFTK